MRNHVNMHLNLRVPINMRVLNIPVLCYQFTHFTTNAYEANPGDIGISFTKYRKQHHEI
jgi:hypothetical protein